MSDNKTLEDIFIEKTEQFAELKRLRAENAEQAKRIENLEAESVTQAKLEHEISCLNADLVAEREKNKLLEEKNDDLRKGRSGT